MRLRLLMNAQDHGFSRRVFESCQELCDPTCTMPKNVSAQQTRNLTFTSRNCYLSRHLLPLQPTTSRHFHATRPYTLWKHQRWRRTPRILHRHLLKWAMALFTRDRTSFPSLLTRKYLLRCRLAPHLQPWLETVLQMRMPRKHK